MPTIIAIDNSLSMSKNVTVADGESPVSKLQFSRTVSSQILDHLTKLELEYIAIASFSSSVEIVCNFTRDTNALKSCLGKIEILDKCCFPSLVNYINDWAAKTWGCMELFHIIVITDGRILLDSESLRSSSCLFDFPACLHFLCLETPVTLSLSGNKQVLHDIINCNKGNGNVLSLFKSHQSDSEIVPTAQNILKEYLDEKFSEFVINLQCGSLSSKVLVFPNPKFSNDDDFESISKFQVLGFLNISDVGNPPVRSRHLLRPVIDEGELREDDCTKDSGLIPSFAVVLHGSLKMESKVAFVRVDEDWFGIVYSWSDIKSRSNLVLSLLPRGYNSVPWMGHFKQLGPENLFSGAKSKSGELPKFPVQAKRDVKRSYAQPTVAWIRATGLQTDVQKILRSAKKLPEKSQVFYKDLNRLRRAALSFGFNELLEGISSLLERECTLLPGTANPEATLQLSHAARELSSSINSGYNYTLEPLKTDFKFNK